jgi:FkbM family methyltransferase
MLDRVSRRACGVVGRTLANRRRLTDVVLQLLQNAPADDRRLYQAFERYLNDADGHGNDDPATNGELWLISRLLPSCNVVVDVGAHRGDWAASALRVNPRLQLHCFEPGTTTFQQLLKREFPSPVRCNNVGLSSTPREAPLYVFESVPALNSLYRRRGLEDGWGLATPDTHEAVKLIRLDDYCERECVTGIDYLKLDVEGHELDVLNGGRRLFAEGRVQFGQFEYGGCNIDSRVLLSDFFGWFEAAGYRLFKLFPDRLLPVARYDQRLENFRYQNWVFARRDLPVPA